MGKGVGSGGRAKDGKGWWEKGEGVSMAKGGKRDAIKMFSLKTRYTHCLIW